MKMKLVTSEIEKSQDTRRITFIASHEKIDRDSEVIVVNGIDTSEFLPNPLLLMQHDQRSRAVGRVTNLRKTMIDGAPALVGEAVFPDRPGSDDALADVKAGLLNSVSIGFRVLEVGPPQLPGQTGTTYLRTKLLEISLVTLPACQTCLVTSKSACTCDDVLPSAPSQVDYAVDALAQTLAHSLAKTLAPAAWDQLDDNQKDADLTMATEMLGKAIPKIVTEAVAREVRSRLLYYSGKVD